MPRPVKRPGRSRGAVGPGAARRGIDDALHAARVDRPVRGGGRPASAPERPLPLLGTCAGLVLVAREVLDGRPDQRTFGVLDACRAPQRVRAPGAVLRGRRRVRVRRRPAAADRVHPGPGPGLGGCRGRRAGHARRRAGAGAPGTGAGVVLPSRAHAGPPGAPALRRDVRVRRTWRASAERAPQRDPVPPGLTARDGPPAIRLLTTASTPASSTGVISPGVSTVQHDTRRPAVVHRPHPLGGHQRRHRVPVLAPQLVQERQGWFGAVDPGEPDAGLGRQGAQLLQRRDVPGDEQASAAAPRPPAPPARRRAPLRGG